ncbi:metal ABC transporter ATP-binding protein [Euzebya sp.]|uniref:metal ABC transporter ATP-binding protein n=1 Tax=Euzebya sp. TaxID=1971409 RepID=UPI0035122A04
MAAVDGVITLDGVALGYGGAPVLADVDLALPAGTLTALIGPNGSGKSTLLHGIAGLITPSAGTIAVLGQPPERVRARIAYVLQRTEDNALLPVSGREVVAMARYAHRGLLGRLRAADRAAVDSALQRMDATGLADSQLRELSGGQQQRLLIAQGLAQDADVLLLDEPVTGLDLVSRDAILDVVRAERDAGRSVVMTTHEMADARAADLVVLLAGRVLAVGPPDEVLTAEHLQAAYGARPIVVGDHVVLDDPHHHHDHRAQER